MRSRLLVATCVVLLTTVSAYAPPFTIEEFYYDDYFGTPVGWQYSDCSASLDSWGTLDGNYREMYRQSCTGPNFTHWCYQKVDGVWVQITCP